MAPKRKADDNRRQAEAVRPRRDGRTRHPAARARTETTAGDDLVGTSAQTAGPTANAAGDGNGIAGTWTSPAMAWLLAVTSGYAEGSPEFAEAVRGAGGGSGYRGFSQSQPQMPSQGMLRPPLGNPAGGRPPFPYQYHAPTGHGFFPGQTQNQIAGPLQTGTGQPQMPSQGMLRPPLDNPAGGRPPFIYQNHAPTGHGSLSGQTQNHAPTGHGSLSGQTQNHVAGPRQTGTGHSGWPSSAISCASSQGAPASPLAQDCYNNFVTSDVLPQHPEIRYAPPRQVPSYGDATQGQGIAIGHQRPRQPSSAAPARVAVGPNTRGPWGPSARWCRLCPAPATRIFCSAPFCEVCYNRVLSTRVPASEQQHRAAAIRPSSSSSSSSSVGSAPICQACGHPSGNRACSFCHHNGNL